MNNAWTKIFFPLSWAGAVTKNYQGKEEDRKLKNYLHIPQYSTGTSCIQCYLCRTFRYINMENITGRKVRTVFAWIVNYSSSIFWSNSISYLEKTFKILNKIYFKHYWILVSYNRRWVWPEGPYHAGVCLTHCNQKHTYKHVRRLLQETYIKTYLSVEIGTLSEKRSTWCTSCAWPTLYGWPHHLPTFMQPLITFSYSHAP